MSTTRTDDPATTEREQDPFLAGAAAGRLMLPRCGSCARYHWYPKACCPWCQSFDITWREVRPEGELWTWTRVDHVFGPDYQAHVPFLLGLVCPLDAPEVRLAAALLDCTDEDLTIGMRMTARFLPPLTGDPVVPWFAPYTDTFNPEERTHGPA